MGMVGRASMPGMYRRGVCVGGTCKRDMYVGGRTRPSFVANASHPASSPAASVTKAMIFREVILLMLMLMF